MRAALGARLPRHFHGLLAAPGIHPGSDLNLRFCREAINQAAVECAGLKPNRHDHRVERAWALQIVTGTTRLCIARNTSLTIVGEC